jgi:hypothetical protein
LGSKPFEQQLLNTLKQGGGKGDRQAATPVEEETAIGRRIAGNLLSAALVRMRLQNTSTTSPLGANQSGARTGKRLRRDRFK